MQHLPIPRVIRRNVVLFALSQSFTGAGMQFAYGLGPLMVIALTDSAALAGLSVGLLGLSRFLVSYPVGRITDSYGRKPGILLGLGLALAGTLIVGLAMLARNPWTLILGMLVFGMGMNAAQQLRVAATDMFPPMMRARALGFVALGSLLGLLISPPLIGLAERLAHRLAMEPLALPWLFLPALIVAGMGLVTLVKPDPKQIGMNLRQYYPGYAPAERAESLGGDRPFTVRALLANRPIRMAIIANCAGVGNMAIVMVLTSLVLHHHGHSLSAIAFSHMFHAVGMFMFTVPLGALADRFAREWVMYPGVAVALLGAILVTFTGAYWLITLGTFLVGLGWAAANVAATALIADLAQTAERGRAIGVNDSFAGAVSVLMALVTGPLIEFSGLPAAGLIAILVSLAPLPPLLLQWLGSEDESHAADRNA